MRPQRAVPLILLLLVVLVGAAPAQRGSQEERLAALEAKLVEIESTQNATLGRLDQIRLDFDNTLEPLRVRLADFGEDVRGMESRLVALEEQLALLNERLLDISNSLAVGGAPVTQRSGGGTPMPPPTAPSGVPGPSVARPAARDQPAPEATRSEAEALYSSAYTDYLAANYALAVTGFEEYLRLFADSDLADNAQYWIGESHYSRQQFQLARTAFQDVSRRFPGAETVPDARFKAARCLVEMGDSPAAIEELRSLVRDHPGADTIPIACLQIERLGGERPLGCPGS